MNHQVNAQKELPTQHDLMTSTMANLVNGSIQALRMPSMVRTLHHLCHKTPNTSRCGPVKEKQVYLGVPTTYVGRVDSTSSVDSTPKGQGGRGPSRDRETSHNLMKRLHSKGLVLGGTLPMAPSQKQSKRKALSFKLGGKPHVDGTRGGDLDDDEFDEESPLSREIQAELLPPNFKELYEKSINQGKVPMLRNYTKNELHVSGSKGKVSKDELKIVVVGVVCPRSGLSGNMLKRELDGLDDFCERIEKYIRVEEGNRVLRTDTSECSLRSSLDPYKSALRKNISNLSSLFSLHILQVVAGEDVKEDGVGVFPTTTLAVLSLLHSTRINSKPMAQIWGLVEMFDGKGSEAHGLDLGSCWVVRRGRDPKASEVYLTVSSM
uniref:Uncharacterized protein n=1 Tax=Cannabis sativa TaxID=3483 RepID=A0A803QJ42_CANSA